MVRTTSGNLPALGDLGTPEEALDELLYNKLYSLVFEGAHRWIDARHYGRLDSLPVDRDGRRGLPDAADPDGRNAAAAVTRVVPGEPPLAWRGL